MRFISWNVNGLRACIEKGFAESFAALDADIFSVQEIKMLPEQWALDFPGYHIYWNPAQKKGYSGTAVFSRQEPLSTTYGIGVGEHDTEGRVITLEFPGYYLINVYTPNSQRELARLGYRMQWEDAFRAYLTALDAVKPVIVCGDMNVAHEKIDLKNPASNRHNAGFTQEERGKMTELLAAGFVDTFRNRYPEQRDAYTWWSYRAGARARNVGWRIDYFLVSRRLVQDVREAMIFPEVMGSDHCPVGLALGESGSAL